MNRYTVMQKKEEVVRNWYEIDAEGKILGKLAAEIAVKLMGKHKVSYTPHVDGGDFVVVTNAEKIAVTGNKLLAKKYYRHSGYPGGLKTRSLEEMLAKQPTEVIRKAVERMLPKNKLGSQMIGRLKIYVGNEHTHAAQKPERIEL
ncbi:50S ribosomal protein L13 [uncultured Leptotrichia sp.]|uniref:50S ribosomal protein L13 n=1 Tax=unclassified Leptotrichia TaxID=2633022 RepID=UPI001B8AEB86|nr:50S ribosomal protein L13 [uncultured Leptotrichia sp.]QUB96804.1 50S ribosomal protein L13 [Leptotrichia sp. oral taxon 221]